MLYETILEATRAWVGEMHHIPYSVIDKLYDFDPDDFAEITPPTKYDTVRIFDKEHFGQLGEILETHDDYYLIKLDSEEKIELTPDEMEVVRDSYFPMWGTMFAFSVTMDNDWLENNLQAMADCGFRIYRSEDYDYVFGIDGCGYDFYEAHWIPLYKARGFQWHKKETA